MQTVTEKAPEIAAPAFQAGLPPDPEFQRLLEKEFSAFASISQFKDAQRMAKMLSESSIVPDTYKGPDKIGDCVIALEIANRIGASVLAVMQNLYIVYGKPGWSSQFLISCINASRRFTPMRYKMTGTPGQDSWGCIAWAQDRTGETLKSPEVTVEMAKAEGWWGKKGSKWPVMTELMLHYRAATLFARLYAPELTMGIQSAEELADMGTKEPAAHPKFTPAADDDQIPGAEVEPPKRKPLTPPVAAPPPPHAGVLQSELEKVIQGAGYSFEQLQKWGESSGMFPDAGSYPSFGDLPDSVCRKLLNAKAGLLLGLGKGVA